MKKTAIDFLNIFLTAILFLLIILYVFELLKNKEFDKVDWTAKIVSVDQFSKDEKSNRIKIIDAVFFNTSNDSQATVHSDSPDLIFSKKMDSLYFYANHDLLPDSLSLKYFSLDEKKFYILNTKLPFDNIDQSIENKKLEIVIGITVEPKGKISLHIEVPENLNFKSMLIQKFQAKETVGKLDEVVYQKSLGEKYNEFPSLTNVSEYSDLIISKYSWIVKIETENDEKIIEISPSDFDEFTIGFSDETFEKSEKRNIPKNFLIKWGNSQRYGSNYYFEAKEILNAFQDLDQIKSDQPIIFNFKLLKNTLPKCEISKGEKTILLKNTYPEIPIKYSN